MAQYINKSAVMAEIESYINSFCDRNGNLEDIETNGLTYETLYDLKNSIDTLEVKEIHEDIDVDLNPLFEELGVEPDSRIASWYKKAFYRGVDRYLNKKENKL